MSKFSKSMYSKYKQTKKSTLIVYLILRALVIAIAVLQFLKGNFENTFICVISLALFTIPTFIEDKLKIDLPDLLEITAYLFIFASEILGEINNFYGIIPYWDTVLHTLNGFVCAAVGFSLIDLLNNNSENLNLSPFYVAFVAFCFSMTVGVCWEFFEYSADRFMLLDMQKDKFVKTISSVELNENKLNKPVIIKNIDHTDIYLDNGDVYTISNGYLDVGINDTMKDLWVNLIGAIAFSIIGFFYIKNRDKNSIASKFIPKKMTV